MSDIAEIPVDEQERPLPPPPRPVRSALVDGPILRTLLSLAWPNVIALSAGTCTVIAETSYIGRLGVEALAAMALVFPTIILTMTMSGGAMGGAVASAIARALGAGNRERAATLAMHAILIGITFGLVFMLGMLIFGPKVLEMLGGRGDVLAHAIAYTQVFFGGAVLPWLLNTMAGVLRGTGNMKLPSFLILNSAAWQIVLGGTLGLGLGPVPQFGMRGVAAGALIAYTMNICIMGWYLFSGRARVTPKLRGLRIQWAMFFDILKVGAIACFSPLQSVLTISIFTHMLAQFGTAILAGYGIGARLEFLLTSIAFSFGIACVPMVGMAIGARQHRARPARRLDRQLCRLRRRRRTGLHRRNVPRSLDQHLHRQHGRTRGEPPISLDGRAVLRVFRHRHGDVLLLARRGQGDRAGAGADGAADLHLRRGLVAVDSWGHCAELFLAGRKLDGRARPALVLQRPADALGTAREQGRDQAGAFDRCGLGCARRIFVSRYFHRAPGNAGQQRMPLAEGSAPAPGNNFAGSPSARKATMTLISALSSHHYRASPLQRLQDELQAEVSSGTVSSSDQTALSAALSDIDSALKSSKTSDRSSGSRPSSDAFASKIDDLIQQEVSAGKLTDQQATELNGIFKAAFSGGPGRPGGPGGAGGPPPGPPPSDGAPADGTDTSSSGDPLVDLLQQFLESLTRLVHGFDLVRYARSERYDDHGQHRGFVEQHVGDGAAATIPAVAEELTRGFDLQRDAVQRPRAVRRPAQRPDLTTGIAASPARRNRPLSEGRLPRCRN